MFRLETGTFCIVRALQCIFSTFGPNSKFRLAKLGQESLKWLLRYSVELPWNVPFCKEIFQIFKTKSNLQKCFRLNSKFLF